MTWLRCTVGRGMLPGEFVVTTRTSGGKEVSLFAQAKFVQEARGLLAVTVMATEAGQSLVALPAESLETQSKTITVPSNELVTL